MEKIVIETVMEEQFVEIEDGGYAKIFTAAKEPDEENGMFVRIQSWDEYLDHVDFDKFVGKKIKITIETVE